MSASWKCSCEFWGIINQVLRSDVGLSSVNQQALMNRDRVRGRHKGKGRWAAYSELGTSYKPTFLFKRIFLTFMTFPLVRLRHHRLKTLRRIKSLFSYVNTTAAQICKHHIYFFLRNQSGHKLEQSCQQERFLGEKH